MRALLGLFLVALGCSGSEDPEPTHSRRERDSVIGASSLPGAGGVRGALRAADSADARNARLDSVSR